MQAKQTLQSCNLGYLALHNRRGIKCNIWQKNVYALMICEIISSLRNHLQFENHPVFWIFHSRSLVLELSWNVLEFRRSYFQRFFVIYYCAQWRSLWSKSTDQQFLSMTRPQVLHFESVGDLIHWIGVSNEWLGGRRGILIRGHGLVLDLPSRVTSVSDLKYGAQAGQ